MIRITTSTADDDNLMVGPDDLYTPGISAAGNAFARVIFEYSHLSLRVFWATRIATAIINGCVICKNWRCARDVRQLGIDSGVIENGQVPNVRFTNRYSRVFRSISIGERAWPLNTLKPWTRIPNN